MYLTIDLLTPVIGAYRTNSRMKYRILKYWPKKWINGVLVFDRLIFFDNTVYNTTTHKKIYSLLGTSHQELSRNSYSGVDYAWFELKSYKNRNGMNYTANLVEDYLNSQTVLNKGYTVPMVYTQQVSPKSLRDATDIDNDTLVSLIEAGYESVHPITLIKNEATGKETSISLFRDGLVSYDLDASTATFAAIYDKDNTLFTKTANIKQRTIVPVYDTRASSGDVVEYTFRVHIEYTFTRVRDASDVECNDLMDLLLGEAQLVQDPASCLIKQLYQMDDIIDPVSNNELFYSGHIRVDGATDLKVKEFPVMIGNAFGTDFKEEPQDKGSWFDKAISFVVALVVVFMSWGAATGPALAAFASFGGGVAGAIAAAAIFSGSMAFMLSITSLVLTLITMAIGPNSSLSFMFGNTIVLLNQGSEVVGYIAMATAVMSWVQGARLAINNALETIAEEALKPAVTEISTASVISTVSDYVVETADYVLDKAITNLEGYFSDKSTGEIINKVSSWLNTGLEMYMDKLSPIPDPGTPQENIVPTSVDTARLTQIDFETYGFIDLNQQMDNMPYVLTEHTVDKKPFSKYYLG